MLDGELLLDGMLGMLIGDGRLGGGVIGAQAVNIDAIEPRILVAMKRKLAILMRFQNCS